MLKKLGADKLKGTEGKAVDKLKEYGSGADDKLKKLFKPK